VLWALCFFSGARRGRCWVAAFFFWGVRCLGAAFFFWCAPAGRAVLGRGVFFFWGAPRVVMARGVLFFGARPRGGRRGGSVLVSRARFRTARFPGGALLRPKGANPIFFAQRLVTRVFFGRKTASMRP
jgi:hypothetical protein